MAKQVNVKIKKNDHVMVMAGKDRGKTGRVLRIIRGEGRVVVEGLNMVKKAMRAKGQNQKGGISSVEAPLQLSNVQIVCKSCGPTRIGYRMESDRKVRFCRKCGEVL
jgi:large subunit ribosomal protein L24